MRVFITWSGPRSRSVAEVVRKWLPGVLQAVNPYFSPDDVAKGSRWFPEISKELDDSQVGLLCVTPENLHAPWLLFEAGALGKNLDKSKVCPLLFGLQPTELTGPLAQFQAARFEKREFKKVVEMINAQLSDAALQSDVLDGVFEMWWPKLEEEVKRELDSSSEDEGELRSDRDMLEEVVAVTRSLMREIGAERSGPHPQALDDLERYYAELLRLLETYETSPEVRDVASKLEGPVSHILGSYSSRIRRRRPRRRPSLADDEQLLDDLEED